MPHEDSYEEEDSPFRLRRSRFTTLEERLEKLVYIGQAAYWEFAVWGIRKAEDNGRLHPTLYKLERLVLGLPERSPAELEAAWQIVLQRANEELRQDLSEEHRRIVEELARRAARSGGES